MIDFSTVIETLVAAYCPSLKQLHPENNRKYPYSDQGNGSLFGDFVVEIARFVSDRKIWFVFDGKVWVPDVGGLMVMELCKYLATKLCEHALQIPNEKVRTGYLDFVRQWQRRRYRETILKDAAGVHPIRFAEFDQKPLLINCLNGTLNLTTRRLHHHCPKDMLTMIAKVTYDPSARSERWERFIFEVTQNDNDKAVYLQKALGYSLTGDTSHDCFFVLYGPTSRNGKSTMLETITALMGDYAKIAMPDTIARKPMANGSGPSEDVARLAGARLVSISELDQGLIMNSAMVKTLTGGDTVTARFLHENSFQYKPQYKIIVNTNHLPSATDPTIFHSGRVKVIPFERHFTAEERDENLKAELVQPQNLSGILNWCIDGVHMLWSEGFREPGSVREAITEYQQDNDKIGQFVDEVLEKVVSAEERAKDIYTQYDMWCMSHEYTPEPPKVVNDYFRGIAIVKRCRPKSGGEKTTMILGYRIKVPSF